VDVLAISQPRLARAFTATIWSSTGHCRNLPLKTVSPTIVAVSQMRVWISGETTPA
jgi:hypothetical protein